MNDNEWAEREEQMLKDWQRFEQEKLKPCPFCGGVAKIEQNCRNGFYLRCTSCVIGYKQKTIRNSLDWLKDKMIENWNKRVYNDPSVKAIIIENGKDNF